MDSSAIKPSHYARTVIIFAVCLFATALLPILGLFLGSELLFFGSQKLFPYELLMVAEADGSRRVFDHDTAQLLNIAQWILTGFGFAWFARRLSAGRAVLAAYATIIAVGIFTQIVFAMIGVSVSIDGL